MGVVRKGRGMTRAGSMCMWTSQRGESRGQCNVQTQEGEAGKRGKPEGLRRRDSVQSRQLLRKHTIGLVYGAEQKIQNFLVGEWGPN